jgi:DNA-binding response OmpR family regulator
MRVLMSVTSWDSVRLQADLTSMGFPVTAADDGIAIFESLDLLGHPVVLMETDLPDLRWQVALDQLRRECPGMSILVIDSRRSDVDRVKAFDIGADDVVSPDVDSAELVSRILAVATRRAGYSSPVLQMGPLRVTLQDRTVWWGSSPIKLSPAQYTIFEKLCLNAPRAVSKHDLMGELYGLDEGSEERIIDVFVANLRARLAAVGAPRDLIETVRGRGYRLAELAPNGGGTQAPFEMPVEDFGIPVEFAEAA